MDDGGQRLLDVIEDTHVLETFLRESFSNSGLEENGRFDHVNVSAENGLGSGPSLDSFMFDGQMVDSLRSGPSHPTHHPHQVSPHIIQGVLHPSNLSAASALSGAASHQLHSHTQIHQNHHLHHQAHHLSQSHLLQHHPSHHHQNSSQLLPNHAAALHSPIGSSLDSDCIVRARDPCSLSRNDSDHTLQQLLASAGPLGSSQQLLHLQQSHQLPLNHPHSHLQSLGVHAHQQTHSHHQNSQQAAHVSTSLPNVSPVQNQHHTHGHQRQHNSPNLKHHHHQISQGTPDISNGILPLGMPTVLSTGSGVSIPNINVQSHVSDGTNHENFTSKHTAHNIAVSNHSPKISISSASPNVVPVQNQSSAKSQVSISSNNSGTSAQIFSSSGLLSNTLQPVSSAQVITGGSLAHSSQNVHTSTVLPTKQTFHINQSPANAHMMANTLGGALITATTTTTSTKGLLSTTSVTASYCSVPSLTSSYFATVSSGSKKSVSQPTIASPTSAATTAVTSSSMLSPFAVPNKSVGSSLPRTSPSPSYPATPSPHHSQSPSQSIKSPAQSPQSQKSSKSPVTPQSTAVISNQLIALSQPSQISISGASQIVAPKVIPSLMQNIVPHLPISQVCANTGLVFSQSGTSVAVAPMKQMVAGSQVIQLVSSQNNQCRQAIALPHPKPIQPKQPQLLPKPSPQGRTVRQSTPPPPGKTFIGSRPTPPSSQQQFVLGAGSQPTVISNQPNLGGLVLNSSILQTGLQQPILLPQPNGVQLLLRPMGQPSGGNSQALLVPVPSQSQSATSVGKSAQPQALVIPGSGQAPAFVLPQGLAPTLAGASMLGTTQTPRPTPQPILRFVAPQQAPLQLQQINTPTGPMLVAVPMGQTTLSIPPAGMFATSNVRPLAPQVAPGTLQIAASPVSLNPLQLAPGTLQVSANNPFSSSQSSLPSIITTTPKSSEEIAVIPANSSQVNLIQSKPQLNLGNADLSRNNKKKSKKKKKEKEPKEDPEKGKAVSINLNELLKETGIFDENEFSTLGIEEADSETSMSTAVVQDLQASSSTAMTSSVSTGADSFKISCGNQVLFNPSVSSSIISNPMAANSAVLNFSSGNLEPINNQPAISISNTSSSVCLTLDPSGRLVLGEAAKPLVNTIAGSSYPSQVLQSAGLQFFNGSGSGLASGGAIIIGGNGEALKIPAPKTTVSSPAASQVISLQTQNGIGLSESADLQHNLLKPDTVEAPKRMVASGEQLFSLVGNTLQPVTSVSETDLCFRLPSHSIAGNDGKLAATGSIPNQISVNNGSVIVSSNYALLPKTIINGSSPSTTLVKVEGNMASVISSIGTKSSSDQNVFVSQGTHTDSKNIATDSKSKKSSKKKRKDEDKPSSHTHSISRLSTTHNSESKEKLVPPSSFPLSSIVIPNGDINTPTESKSRFEPSSLPNIFVQTSKVLSSPTISNVLVAVTSNSIVSTLSSSSSKLSSAPSLNGGSKASTLPLPLSSHPSTGPSPGAGYVVQPGHHVKQLLLSPQNQEALKRVHTQIQELQAKKGPLRDEDKSLQQRLISEYRKIIATGKPIPVSHNLTQPLHTMSTVSTQNSVKYSHSVGHKKILFAPNHKKSSKRSSSESSSSHSQSKSKGNDVVGASLSSSSSTNSSHTGLATGAASNAGDFMPANASSRGKACEDRTSETSEENRGVDVIINVASRGALNASMPMILATTRSSTVAGCSPGYQNTSETNCFGTASKPTLIMSSQNVSSTSSRTSFIPIRSAATVVSTASSSNQSAVPMSSPAGSEQSSARPFSHPLTRDQLFEHQLRTDQNGALNPEYKTPFKNRTDACKRLIRYHVYNERHPTPTELAEADLQFEYQSENLLKKFKSMKYKYQSLLLRDSLRRHPSSETAMLYRMFIQEEKHNLERLKTDIATGKDLNLPALPRHWLKGEPAPPSEMFPWEDVWPSQKEYIYTREPKIEGSLSDEDELTSGAAIAKEESFSPPWELEEGRLQIMEDEEESAKSSDRPISRSNTGSRSDGRERAFSSPDDLPCPEIDSFDQLEAEIQEEYLDDRICSGGRTASSGEDEADTHSSKGLDSLSVQYCNGDEGYVHSDYGAMQNGYENSSDGSCYSSACDWPSAHSEEKLSRANSLSGPRNDGYAKKFLSVSSKSDGSESEWSRERVSEKFDSRRNRRRKHDKGKKVKIKMKGEDVVPPLRIKSDGSDLHVHSKTKAERSLGGGLKLTLKKQEGSGDYYRVGDGLVGREFRDSVNAVDQNGLVMAQARKRKFDVSTSNGRLKSVSVVLEDCLQAEQRDPCPPYDELSRDSPKRNKKIKSFHYKSQSKSTTHSHEFFSSMEKKENVSTHVHDWNHSKSVKTSGVFQSRGSRRHLALDANLL